MSADDMTANGVSASDISSSEIAANAITTNDLVNEVGAIASQSPNDIFTAERIVKQRMYCKKKQYFIKWKDYPESDNSWEPAENIYDSILIKNFKKEQSALKSIESGAVSDVSKKKKSSKQNSSILVKEPQEASKSLELRKSNEQASMEQAASKDTTSDMDAIKKKKNKSSSKRNSSTLEKQLSQSDSKPSKKSKLSNSFAQTPKEQQQPILKSDSESSGYSNSHTPIIETNDNQNNDFGGNSMSSPSVFAHKSSPNSYGNVEPILNGGSELPTYPVITSNSLAPVASVSATTNLMNDSVLPQYAGNVGTNNVHHNNNCNLPAYFTHAQKDNISFSLTINGITRTCSFQTLWSTNQPSKEVPKPSFNLPS